jgi:cyclopropane fatty-acyl-phospholipid synthase-like methyltransferase
MFKTLGEQLRRPSGFMGRLVSKMMEMRNKESYKEMIKALDIQSGDKIFEIGYGPGLGINLIANNTVDCTISGIDFSELMYREATKRNRKFIDRGMVTLKYGDLLTADLERSTYDKIFCLNVIYFWSELQSVFVRIHSMLNAGGLYFIFMTPAGELENLKFTEGFNKYRVEMVESELKKAGFSAVEYKLDKGYYIKARK